MKYTRQFIFTLVICVLICICSSCINRKEESIQLDNSQPLALAPDVSWAVVSNPYAAYRIELGWNSESQGHCRKGEILQVLGSSQDEKNDIWYHFKDGWLPGDCVLIYSNRYKAQKMSEEITNK